MDLEMIGDNLEQFSNPDYSNHFKNNSYVVAHTFLCNEDL